MFLKTGHLLPVSFFTNEGNLHLKLALMIFWKPKQKEKKKPYS